MIKVRIRVDSKCKAHPKYNPAKDGHPRPDCHGCDRIYVIYLYSQIVAKAAADDKVSTRGTVLIDRPEDGEKDNERDNESQGHGGEHSEVSEAKGGDNANSGASEGKSEAAGESEKSSDAA